MSYCLTYAISLVGGYLIAGGSVYLMRISIGARREFFRWIDLWVGLTERSIATTLALFSPHLVAPFIGWWIALKFAANWKRRAGENIPQKSLVSLVGGLISFAVAITATMVVKPEIIATFSN